MGVHILDLSVVLTLSVLIQPYGTQLFLLRKS